MPQAIYRRIELHIASLASHRATDVDSLWESRRVPAFCSSTCDSILLRDRCWMNGRPPEHPVVSNFSSCDLRKIFRPHGYRQLAAARVDAAAAPYPSRRGPQLQSTAFHIMMRTAGGDTDYVQRLSQNCPAFLQSSLSGAACLNVLRHSGLIRTLFRELVPVCYHRLYRLHTG